MEMEDSEYEKRLAAFMKVKGTYLKNNHILNMVFIKDTEYYGCVFHDKIQLWSSATNKKVELDSILDSLPEETKIDVLYNLEIF